MLKRIVSIVRSLVRTPAPVAALPAPAPVAPAPVWGYKVTRTRGSFISTVAVGSVEAESPSAALALIALRGLAHPGEAVEIDGKRWRMWAAARPTPIDPAKRGSRGERRRDRERGISR